MSNDRDIDRAVTSGERNKRTIELVHNWCVHAKVKKMGGVGLIEQETGLPIGHHAVVCDHAPAGGMATWDLADAALDFHDRNCVGCTKRQAVRLPNLSELVGARDRAHAHEDAEQEHRARAAQEALSQRRRTRESLRAGQAAPVLTLIDDLDRLDLERSKEAHMRIVETAILAPEVFTAPIIDHFFGLLDAREHWFIDTGLLALRQLSVDKRRLALSAMRCLSTRDAIEAAASIAEENVDNVDEAMVSEAVAALVLLARAPRSSFTFDNNRVSHPGPLLALFKRWPASVCTGIQQLLDQRRPFWVMTGARALGVLAQADSSVPLQFARSLAAKLARAHLLLDEDETSRGLDDVCNDLQEGLSLALFADPKATDEMLISYYDSASPEGEARLIGVYERLFVRVRRDDKISGQAAYATALRRLVWAATTSTNDEVLREVLHAFHGEPDALTGVARSQLDSLLGAAALMDDRAGRFDADARLSEPRNMLEALDRNNKKTVLYQFREAFARWAASAAADDEHATSQYVDFLARVITLRDGLSSTLVGQVHHLMRTPRGLNAVLPVLYSALLGSSNLTRAMAAEMLGKLSRNRVTDLPDLVFEAFVPLLRDRYVVVHQSAARALEKLDLPEAFDRAASSALAQLIFVYKDDKTSHDFLMDCIALFVRRYLDDEGKKKGIGEVLVALVHGVEPDVAVRELRYIARKLAHAKGYTELILRIIGDDKAMSYLEEDALKLLNEVPATAVFANRQELGKVALRRVSNSVVVGSFVEVLTRAGAWAEAQKLAQAFWEQVPDTIQMRQVKWATRLLYVAVSFEASVAAGRMDDLAALGQEWRDVAALVEKDRQENAERRDPLRGILRSHQSR